ncbi:hypothetical protein AAZX31_14G121700 [Glycine max]
MNHTKSHTMTKVIDTYPNSSFMCGDESLILRFQWPYHKLGQMEAGQFKKKM